MRSFIGVLEGSKGERWRRFATMLKEVVSMSSVLGVKNKASMRVSPLVHIVLG